MDAYKFDLTHDPLFFAGGDKAPQVLLLNCEKFDAFLERIRPVLKVTFLGDFETVEIESICFQPNMKDNGVIVYSADGEIVTDAIVYVRFQVASQFQIEIETDDHPMYLSEYTFVDQVEHYSNCLKGHQIWITDTDNGQFYEDLLNLGWDLKAPS